MARRCWRPLWSASWAAPAQADRTSRNMSGRNRNGLGIDAGGSATRWALCDAQGVIVAQGEVQAVSGHLYDEANRARFAEAAQALAAQLSGAGVGRVLAGITGLSAPSPQAELAAGMLAGALGIAPDRVDVNDDMWIAYHAAFAPGEGHVVYAGSGSVGIHVRADGTALRVGGRGMLIDDAGSAFAIGRAALNLVLRRLDEDPGARGALAEALFAWIGGDSWADMRSYVYGGGRTAVAMLARAVAQADDADARAILHTAGQDLARLAHALARREGVRPVALLGRAASLHPAILQGFREAAPDLQVTLCAPDAAAAAARLAAQAR
jgi:glucosamine kinase